MKTYSRGNRLALMDRIRKTLVPDTPEERVRQEYLSGLIDYQGFPESSIDTEYSLSRIDKHRRGRVDIVVWEKRYEKALLIAETKSPSVSLTGQTLNQAIKYQKTLGGSYIVTTNGADIRSYRLEQGTWREIGNDFTYDNLKSTDGLEAWEEEDALVRLEYSEVTREDYLGDLVSAEYGIIGEDTPREMHPTIAELHNFLLCHDFGDRFPLQHCGFEVIEDLGHSCKTYGNASGGHWPGEYRGFLIRDLQGDHQIYRVGILGQAKLKNDPKWKTRKGTTMLIVAVDDFDLKPHNSLQLRLDSSLNPANGGYWLSHDGRKSSMPSAKIISGVRKLAPHLLSSTASRVNLGYIPKGASLTWALFGPTLLNLLLYASIRETVKKHHK